MIDQRAAVRCAVRLPLRGQDRPEGPCTYEWRMGWGSIIRYQDR